MNTYRVKYGVLTGFSGNDSRIVIPEGVHEIGSRAFADCKQITQVVFPKHSLRKIGDWAFSGCSGIRELWIPDSVTELGKSAFLNCSGLKRLRLSRAAVVPPYAFSGCTALEELTVPEGVRELGYCAFHRCTSLKELSFPRSLQSIGEHAFRECTSLVELLIPETVQKLEQCAFYECKGLSKLTVIPKDIPVGNHCFYGCESLRELHIHPELKQLGRLCFYGCSRLADRDGFVIINRHLFYYTGCCTRLTIPEGVEVLGSFFYPDCDKLLDIRLPQSLQVLESCALYACHRLRRVILPENVECIGGTALSRCRSLEEIQLLRSGDVLIENSAFDYLPVNVRILAPETPISCFPAGMKPMMARQFTEAVSRGERIPEELVKRNRDTIRRQRKFFYPHAVKSEVFLDYMLKNSMIPLEDADGLLKDESCSAEARLMLLNYREKTFSEAQKNARFEKDLGLRPLSAAELHRLWRTKKLPDGSLCICGYRGKEADLILPDRIGQTAVTAIDSKAFNPRRSRLSAEEKEYYSAVLRSVIIPEGVTGIGALAFSHCDALEEVTVPASLREIGIASFLWLSRSFVLHTSGSEIARSYARSQRLKYEDT